uniref:Uncharacterized protein n=1 Tax=Anguilla anguilla TaxID=7936 RepID=A0A0E9V0W9_ANGAN
MSSESFSRREYCRFCSSLSFSTFTYFFGLLIVARRV